MFEKKKVVADVRSVDLCDCSVDAKCELFQLDDH